MHLCVHGPRGSSQPSRPGEASFLAGGPRVDKAAAIISAFSLIPLGAFSLFDRVPITENRISQYQQTHHRGLRTGRHFLNFVPDSRGRLGMKCTAERACPLERRDPHLLSFKKLPLVSFQKLQDVHLAPVSFFHFFTTHGLHCKVLFLLLLFCCLVTKLRLTFFSCINCFSCSAPLSLGFPRQEYWSGFPFPSSRGSF